VAVHNEKLGDFYLTGIPPKVAGVETIEVEMVVNLQGILTVSAVNAGAGIRQVSVIESKQRMGREAIQAYLQLEGVSNYCMLISYIYQYVAVINVVF